MNAKSPKQSENGRLRPQSARAFKCRKPGRVAETSCRSGAAAREYKRARDLPRLLAVWPRDIQDTSNAGIFRVIAKLRQALRAERRRGLAGRWSYDLERHLAWAKALKAELEALEGARRPGRVLAPLPQKKVLKKQGPRDEALANPLALSAGRRNKRRPELRLCGAAPGPSSWRAPSGPPHNWGRPSDSHGVSSIFPDILPESDHSESEDGASGT